MITHSMTGTAEGSINRKIEKRKKIEVTQVETFEIDKLDDIEAKLNKWLAKASKGYDGFKLLDIKMHDVFGMHIMVAIFKYKIKE